MRELVNHFRADEPVVNRSSPRPGDHSRAASHAGRFMSRGSMRRLVAVCLLAAAGVVGASTLTAAADRTSVWAAARDLSPGVVLTQDDLRVADVAVPDEGSYIAAGLDTLVGRSLVAPLAAGDLVARSAIAGQATPALREVTVAVGSHHAPLRLSRGDMVDVYSSDSRNGGDARLVASSVFIAAVDPTPSRGTGEIAIVLAVQPDSVAGLLSGVRGKTVDLVVARADGETGLTPSPAVEWEQAVEVDGEDRQ